MAPDAGLELARRLISAGIPVVVVKPGDIPPKGWQTAAPDLDLLAGYRPGTDALALVGGHGIDLVDEDRAKPEHSVDNLPPFTRYGLTGTPSGGRHYVVPSCGLPKVSPLRTALGPVGDYVGGRPDGTGRLLGFLPGSHRSKYPGVDYLELEPWEIEGCLAAEPDADLVDALLAAGATQDDVPRYLDDSAERPPEAGTHPYAVSAANGELDRLDACELMGWDGEPWDATTFAVACNLIELANSRWSGYPLEEAEREFLEHAPTDPGFGPAEHLAKWTSALNRVAGGGRRPPGDLAPAVEPSAIFDATPVLQHVRQAAHSRMVGSGALLCFVLGRVLAEAPPSIVLPPTIGAPASLNLAFALVGKSGDGKSVTSSVSSALLGLDQAQQETGLGSGEGLMEAFLETTHAPDPNDPSKSIKVKRLVDPPVRILEIDEIGQLGAVGKRDGSSMMPVLRSALTGGALKSANATAERRRNIEKGSYRLVAFCGVQPELSDVLLHDAVGGTPQRFVWVSVSDKTIEREAPAWPGPLDWSPVHLEAVSDSGYTVSYPEHVKATILEARYTQVKNGLDPLHGHLLLTRLKVAAALAFLHDELDISDRWWALAGLIIDWSNQEQQRCAAVLAATVAARDTSKGRSEARAEEAREDATLERVKEGMVRRLLGGGWHSWSSVRSGLRATVREHSEEALASLLAEGRVEVEDTGQQSRRLRLAPKP